MTITDKYIAALGEIAELKEENELMRLRGENMGMSKREFEDGVFYPVIHNRDDNLKDIAWFSDGYFSIIGTEDELEEGDFSWIGEELSIDWAKQISHLC